MVVRSNINLSPHFCGSYKILKMIGPIAYKLDLPNGSKIYHIFYVSKLKKQVDYQVIMFANLLEFSKNDELRLQLVAILDMKMVKKNTQVKTKVLVQWDDIAQEDTTQEYLYKLQEKFTGFQP